MNYLLVLIAASNAAIAATSRNSATRIIGGENTTIEEHPYQVSIQYSFGFPICSGAIVKPNYVLTAAHCFLWLLHRNITVQAGSTSRRTGGTLHPIESFRLHPKFSAATIDCDVAVVTLKTPIMFSASASSISLVPPGERPRNGEMLTITGWGIAKYKDILNSVNLQVVRRPVIDRSHCSSVYADGSMAVTDQMFCAGGGTYSKGPFKGDSGGPAVDEKKQLVGLVSWGHSINITGYPAVFTDISSPIVRAFIDERIK